MEPVGEGKESHPEGGGLIRPDVPDEAAVRQERNPAGGTPVVDGGKDSVGPVDDTSLNARLLDKLNEQFEKQIQLLERDQLDDGFKLNVYAEWVQSLRLLNTELVQSLREMQDTCMERMQLMRAAYLKDLERFGPDVRLKRLASAPDASANVSGEQIVALELSSNYPIVVPATDEMLVRELDAKASIIDEQRRELQELRKQMAESGSILEQLRNMTQEREKQLDDKQKEIAILQHQIVALNDQLQKAKMKPPVLQQTSFTSFASARSEDDDSPGSPRLLFERLGTLQQDSDAESEYVQLLKAELAELRAQLQHAHKQRSQREESEQALFRLRAVCGELLQSTGRLRGCGYRWREDCEEGGHFEDDDELIEAMRDRCDALCRQLEAAAAETSSHKPNGMVEQDEGIGSASTSRLEHSDPISPRDQQQVMLGGKEHSNNSASESLSSLSLGLDEGGALQGLIDDLKKEIESKDLVLRDRHDAIERLQQELSNRDRQLSRCRERQELLDGEKTSFLQKIVELEENVDDHGRTIAMLNMEKVKLLRQVEDLKETLQQYRDNLQKTSEEKVAIEDECKNLLVTISNLRVALEETKRNGSSSVSFFSGLRYSQPPPTTPQSYRVSYLHANGKDNTQSGTTTPSPTLTNTAGQSGVTENGSSSSSSRAAPGTGQPGAPPAQGSDYWSAIGRALFSGFES